MTSFSLLLKKKKGEYDTEMGKPLSALTATNPYHQNILFAHLQQLSAVYHTNSKGIGSLHAAWGKHCSSTASRIHVAGIYVQLIRNSNITGQFREHNYIITLLMTNGVKEHVRSPIECDCCKTQNSA
jgi:hypothetical protein